MSTCCRLVVGCCAHRAAVRLALVLLAMSAAALPAYAQPQELIVNGDFTSFGTGWTAIAVGNGGWFLDTVGTSLPRSGLPTSGAGGGAGTYAVSDQTGTGTHGLLQTFHVPTPVQRVVLRFDVFVNDWSSSPMFDPEQHARVDIITADSPGLDIGAAVLFNAYTGTDGGPLPNDFTHYEFDITPVVQAGGDFRVRFYSTARFNVLNHGVDNVSIFYVPEPATGWLALATISVLGVFGWKRKRFAVGVQASAC